jgi:hypothetical protein
MNENEISNKIIEELTQRDTEETQSYTEKLKKVIYGNE